MKSPIVRHTVVINGHQTGVSLEDPFWIDLKAIAHAQQMTLSDLVTKIDGARDQGNLSSALRLFVLRYIRTARCSRGSLIDVCLESFTAQQNALSARDGA